MHVARRHDSAHKHVTGLAEYIDDMPEPAGTLHGCLGLATEAHADIVSMDLEAVRAAPGVVAVLTAADVPGVNDISPTGRHDEPVLAEGRVEFHGQPIFAVIAKTREAARRACALAAVEYRPRAAFIDVVKAMEAGYPMVTDPLDAEARRRGRRRSGRRRAASRARCASAGRTISTSKARSPWRSPARTRKSPSGRRRSTRARSSTWSPTPSAWRPMP